MPDFIKFRRPAPLKNQTTAFNTRACPQGIKHISHNFRLLLSRNFGNMHINRKSASFRRKKNKYYFWVGPTWAQQGPIENLAPTIFFKISTDPLLGPF